MRCFLAKLKLFFRFIPSEINDDEKIVKVIFNPLNINKKGDLKPNTFRCPNDDLSVNRLNYSSLDLCKCQGINLEKKASKEMASQKKFFGIALIFAREIRELSINVFYRPVFGNKAHAEIVTGIRGKVGEAMTAEYIYLTDKLASSSRVYVDSDTRKRKWVSRIVASEITNLK